MSVRAPYPNDDLDRLVNEADKQAMASGVVSVRWHYPTPTERVLARWVIEARQAEADPHRAEMLAAIASAWAARPSWTLGQVIGRAAPAVDTCRACRSVDVVDVPDADFLAGLRALVKG